MSLVENVVVLKSDAKSVRFLSAWIKETVNVELKAIDKLRSGWVYCQIMHRLFPRAMPLSKVFIGTTTEREFEVNFFILKRCFDRLQMNRSVPVRDLYRGRGHYDFLNYIYKFYEANIDKSQPYDAKATRSVMRVISRSRFRRPIARVMPRRLHDPGYVLRIGKNREIERAMQCFRRTGSKTLHQMCAIDLKMPGRKPMANELNELREKVASFRALAEKQYQNVEQTMETILAIATDISVSEGEDVKYS